MIFVKIFHFKSNRSKDQNDFNTVDICSYSLRKGSIKGCGMGPWLAFVSPCFRKNVAATYKIGSFLCSLDNLLQKNVFFFLFWKSTFKMAVIWKNGYFWPTYHIFTHQRKVTKILSAHTSLTYIHVFCSPYWLFCLTNFEKKYEFIRYGFFWYDPWCWFLFAPFWNN